MGLGAGGVDGVHLRQRATPRAHEGGCQTFSGIVMRKGHDAGRAFVASVVSALYSSNGHACARVLRACLPANLDVVSVVPLHPAGRDRRPWPQRE